MVTGLCHIVISLFRLFTWRYQVMARRKDEKTPRKKDELTKKRHAKNEIASGEKANTAMRKDDDQAHKNEKRYAN